MNRKNLFILGLILVAIGIVAMILLKGNDNRFLISGAIIGAGGGFLAVISAPKNNKTN
ncbi:hypothetical protein [Winogradskyella alexanderae]|uniref:Uncharacterized protein n=1 Tax=Winogradskyella alexanderae TaxID=2877123 RepID=A0ABS7XU12_9FLAO|nr:hypothetical protein [Winogradskyella alexanderae]MCA0133516.1 hypothetical protein [Winogradskyella alexanderae]